MTKKTGIFKQFQEAAKVNPLVAFAMLWVTFMPSIGSLALVPWAISNPEWFGELDFLKGITIAVGLIVSSLLMGLALMPTTMVAGLSGFLLGWPAFPWLVLGYTLATVLGYAWGRRAGGDSLDLILSRFPKAAKLIEEKSDSMGELIFFVRLSPVIPFALSNFLFALLQTGYLRLLIFGTIGMLPRTAAVFFTGTLASDLIEALLQGDSNYNVIMFTALLLLSIWGIWKFFTKKPQ
ncbi:TVP38/TMEM64 family protein [Arthrospiribacter ruber]|uniref:TVP38/TMEM64 family membrane protein n=1 Tax=Arthrospiribacter ruber TaxID=2487934 RepID=A0A951J1H7_9BACT|nr:VTT domain-containing protein [Arthrospiribacter ruber]MBW3469696.1 hypothetical protein [Arthrospiribacter ruber]